MNDEIPQSVVTGRKVAMALLVIGILVTIALVLWLIASLVTASVVV
ncbi:MAG TPA: hypothetical protein VFV67_29755 [Actinophytocola sp.]|nr:hypothetical protein [Actinophytocola sp.]HEU5474850.1 hypothetical protein [Actinophytocola sp.]